MSVNKRNVLTAVAHMNRQRLKGMNTPSNKQFLKISKWAQKYRAEHVGCTDQEVKDATAAHFNITIVGPKNAE